MIRFKLFLMQLKSAVRYYAKGLSVLTALFAVAACLILAGVKAGSGKGSAPVSIGVVVEGDDSIFDYLLSMVESIEGVKTVCSMEKMDRTEAFEGLKAGDVQLVMVVPENFYQDASSFKETSIQVYVSKEPSPSGKKVLAMIDGAEKLMTVTEGAILSMYDGMEAFEVPVTKGRMESDLFEDVVSAFSERTGRFGFTVLSAYGDYSILQFYISAALVALMTISGVFYFGMYRHGATQLERMIYRGSLSGLWSSLSHIIAMTLITACGGALLVNILTAVCGRLSGETLVCGGRGYMCIFAIALSVSAWVHLAASAAGDSSHSRCLYMLLVLLFLAAGGVMVPAVYLPGRIRDLSTYIPCGSFQTLLLSGLWGKRRLNGLNTILVTDVFVCVTGISTYCRGLLKHD